MLSATSPSNKEIVLEMACLLNRFLKIEDTVVIPRVENYKPDDSAHNEKQPLQSVQLEFSSESKKDQLEQFIKENQKNQG